MTTLIIDLSQDIDIIWKNIRKTRRAEINKAKKLGMTIEMNSRRREWYMLFEKLNEHLGRAVPISIEDVQNKIPISFVGVYNKQVLAGEMYIIIDSDGTIRTEYPAPKNRERLRTTLAASKRFEFDIDKKLAAFAHSLVIWSSIQYAKENGYKLYDFGGYNVKNEIFLRVSNWKISFGGKEVEELQFDSLKSRLKYP